MASKEITYNNQPFQLSYELLNPAAKDAILILHGWGSNSRPLETRYRNINISIWICPGLAKAATR